MRTTSNPFTLDNVVINEINFLSWPNEHELKIEIELSVLCVS